MKHTTVVAGLVGLVIAASGIGPAPDAKPLAGKRRLEQPVQIGTLGTLQVTTSGRVVERPPQPVLGGCIPVVASHTDADFTGGLFIVQAGVAQGETFAASYTLDPADFPIKFELAEMIFATSGATVTTTTKWSFLVWEGTPDNGNLIFEFSSDGKILPHIVLPPGTNGVNVQVLVDPGDPEQIIIEDIGNATFTIGYRIDEHNDQQGNPCFEGPRTCCNAFPTTDVSGLLAPGGNWIDGVNCGPLGCPPNGGWASFQELNSLCTPSGDWVMRATWSSVQCQPGACCLPTGACIDALNSLECEKIGGTFQGDGSTCLQTECPTIGACCLPDGSCLDGVEIDACAAQGGVFQGPGSECADASCPTVACCFGDGCLELFEEDCLMAGGVSQGLGTTCAAGGACPVGACCLGDASCTDLVTASECAAQGGVFQGVGTDCGGVTCTLPDGACCFPTGFCLVLSQEDCGLAGAAWQGPATQCDPDPCGDEPCPWDCGNGDGHVDTADLLALLGEWGQVGSPCDFDGSGTGTTDMLDLLAHWGACP